MPITASMLYNVVTCPHRVTMDLCADSAERDPISPFVRLLWERGVVHEGPHNGRHYRPVSRPQQISRS